MEFSKLLIRFRQFGGLRLLAEYARVKALRPALKEFYNCISNRKSFKAIYSDILKTVEPYLIDLYSPMMKSNVSEVKRLLLKHCSGNTIWFCWLQGLENAPVIVRACCNSLQKNLKDREIKVIDSNNWQEYVELPELIVKKWKKGRIPPAMFSDLLRLQLLINYGGTWIDSTVLCTGSEHIREYLDASLFLFQYTPQGTTDGISISNWFITSCTNNEVLLVLRDMLFAYWKDYVCVLDYYIFHLFFSMIAKEFPETVSAMPYGNSRNSLAILHHWSEPFDKVKWDKITSRVSFHKLSARPDKATINDETNYYNEIIRMFS